MTNEKNKHDATTEDDLWAGFDDIPSAEEILKADTPLDLETDPAFQAACLKAQVIEDIYRLMEEGGVKKKRLAEMLGKSPQYVGRVLAERANFTLDTLAKIACALGGRVTARLYTKDECFVIRPKVAPLRPGVLASFTPAVNPADNPSGANNHVGYSAA